MSSRPPKVSVVVPVYNVAPYVRDCLDSVLAQTIPDWECICVDDGSTDGSGAVCDEYAARDSRFHVIHQPNSGLSEARNAAVQWAISQSPGDYLTFLDSDDWLAANCLEEMLRGAALGDGVAACPFRKVGEGTHFRNETPPPTRWTRLSTDEMWTSPTIIGSTACGKLFPKSFFSGIRFPPGKIHEDEWTTHRVLFQAGRAALADQPLYFYRQRGDSIVNRPWSPERLDAIEAVESQVRFFLDAGKPALAERCRAKLARLCQDSLDRLQRRGKRSHVRRCRRALRCCIPDGPLSERLANPLYAMAHPHRARWLSIVPNIRKGGVWYAFKFLFFRRWTHAEPPAWVGRMVLQHARLAGGSMRLTGFVPADLAPDPDSGLRLVSGSVEVPVALGPVRNMRFRSEVLSGRPFDIRIDRSFPCGTFGARLVTGENGKERPLPMSIGPGFPLSALYRFQRLRAPDGGELRRMPDGRIRIDRPCALRRAARTFLFLSELFARRTEQDWYAAFLRMQYAVWRRFHRRRFWIFSDKLANPIDNAWAVAEALVSGRASAGGDVSPWYLVDGRHSLRVPVPPSIGTVRFLSRLHKLLYLAAEANVTSEEGYNPFSPRDPYVDLTAWQLRVFTTHGIIHHDLSALYGRDSGGFHLVLSGARREREYVAGGLWGYADDEVVLTGLPRWDARSNAPAGKIYLGFTWRNNLVEGFNATTYERSYGDRFRQSDYLARLRSLMADGRLRDAAEKAGCRIVLLPHPLLRSAMPMVPVPEWVEVVPEDVPYERIYRDASMLVTDYSSVAMDMAYLGKPVVYWQFDRDEFYATQGYTPSFWSWENDGFGPVTATLDETVDAIVACIRAGFVREPEYERRARGFFVPRDRENGARACRAILDRLAKSRGAVP